MLTTLIGLLEDCIESAQDLKRVEKACQDVGLYLNAPKKKYMHLNPSTEIGRAHV